MDMATFSIGELARRGDVGIDTVRYYERSGLLNPATRTAAGYRQYGADELARLNFIRRAQRLGFSLGEISELLAITRREDVRAVRAAARAHLLKIDARIAELQRMREALHQLVDACPGGGHVDGCPILGALNESGASA